MTASVILRPYELSDAQTMYDAVRESQPDLVPWMPWATPDYSLEQAAAWIQVTLTGHQDQSMFDFAILDGQGNYVGGCGVNHVDRVERFANLGYWVRSSCAGRGIAPAAVRLLASWTFANTNLNRLEIVVAVGNSRSQRVAEKVSARREAVLRKRIMVGDRASDAIMYSIVRPDSD